MKKIESNIKKFPQVEGENITVSPSQDFLKVLDEAEQFATKSGDTYVTVERLLQALLSYKSYGVDLKKLNKQIDDLRKGKAKTRRTDSLQNALCSQKHARKACFKKAESQHLLYNYNS